MGTAGAARQGARRIDAKTERRDAILRHATKLFRDDGFSETTMDDVAAAAGITKRTLYRYVKTKDQLLVDIHGKFRQALEQYQPIDGEPVDRLVKLIERHVAIVTSQTAEIGVFFDERKYLSAADQAEIGARRRRYTAQVVSALEEGQQVGSIEPIDSKLAARVILGTITEIYRWYQPGVGLEPNEIATQITDLVLHGVMVAPPADDELDAITRDGSRPDSLRQVPNTAADKVLEAATQSFARLGYRAATIRELAAAAGITNGAVMYHAGDKHALLEQIHVETFSEGLEVLKEQQLRGGSPWVVLAHLLGAQMSFLAEHAVEIAVINENIKFLETDAYRRVNLLRTEFLAIFDQAVRSGVESGDFAVTDPRLVGRLIVGMVNAPYRWFDVNGSADGGHRASSADLAVVLAKIALRGVSTGERSTSL